MNDKERRDTVGEQTGLCQLWTKRKTRVVEKKVVLELQGVLLVAQVGGASS